jgi:hypothetical protein
MAKIVLELQQEAISKESDILNLLRKAYLVARKLKLNEFENWINNELNGYKDMNKLPDYRKVRGEVKAWNPYHGWIPVILEDDEIDKAISEHLVSDSIPNLKNVYDKSSNGTAVLQFGAGMNQRLGESSGFATKYALIIGVNQIYNIMEKVRNIVLDWSITLEDSGILGEGLQFTDKEKEIANTMATINNYTNNFYGDVKDTQIQQDIKDSMQE